ncbi:probable tyrosyl-DNA phosphodiesterase [Aricia agestis]|uniref:probable tyrosyl-DNA phosphodiesterase n=1 Tax=Aricia agestis TaxID=91739 RepID=UPI001C209EAB|nr:probable tyrosyl-DNA phosphodiesterase [Aricia agestis]
MSSSKRMNKMNDHANAKRVKKECNYGESCYRLNPAHLREYSHPHLEEILDNHSGSGSYVIPDRLSLQRSLIVDQLNIIVEKQLYEPKKKEDLEDVNKESKTNETKQNNKIKNEPSTSQSSSNVKKEEKQDSSKGVDLEIARRKERWEKMKREEQEKQSTASIAISSASATKAATASSTVSATASSTVSATASTNASAALPATVSTTQLATSRDSDYKPIVPPTRRIQEYFKVVRPPGGMAAKHDASAPYHVFYTTITDSRETHGQPYSITFQEILDRSLGELKCSLQINFMVDVSWLMAHYYFAGYSAKNLTILYGEDSPDLRDINKKKPNVQAHHVTMATPFGKHHTKMMILCYEDGSLRVVISTANLYLDDWENRTQGLWFSPRCPELAAGAAADAGESPTRFKRDLLRYLHHYRAPHLSYYVDRVKRCDFSRVNVFLVSSVPGSHTDLEWGMVRVGALLRQHCAVPPADNARWPLIAQASSLGSYGKEPKLWLTGDFLTNFTKTKNQTQMLTSRPELKLIYPSLENVKQSHDGLLGGGCLPYAADVNNRQPWLKDYLFQWRATHSARDRAMPHIKSYLRLSPDHTTAAYYLLTSGNTSKAAWGCINKGNAACRVMSYEAGVLLLPQFLINEDFFPLSGVNKLEIPYDLPPTRYTPDMTPWLICLWCALLAAVVADDEYYAPQTFRQVRQQSLFRPSDAARTPTTRREVAAPYAKTMFTPAVNDVVPQGSVAQTWRPGPSHEIDNYNREQETSRADWRMPYGMSKEQQAAILHHKQSLSSEGAFRFEYASDNGLSAGEQIAPDGSRIGAYQYKNPSGQLVKLKYRAGKEGFQVLEGSHLPKSPEPVAPQAQDNYYQEAYEQQRDQYQLQQQYNQQRPEPQEPVYQGRESTAPQYFAQNYQGGRDDGQYRDNYLEENRGPHSFGSGYAFAFQG